MEQLTEEERHRLEEEKRKLKEDAAKKVKDGWIHTVMMIEVLAVTEEAALNSLDQHVAQLKREKKTLLFRADFGDVEKVENPLPNTPVGYSRTVEAELAVQDFETLIFLVLNYGPTATEILHPRELKMDMGEAQGIVNSVADVIHQFAAQGLGGIIIRS